MKTIPKPQPGEYAPYAIMYIDLLPDDGLVLKHLETNFQMVKDFVYSLPTERLTVPHAPGEWTVKDILVHIVDDERIYSYRTLRFARGDTTELPGFDQELFAAQAGANDRTLEDIFEEYAAVRQATITLFNSFAASTYEKAGLANGHIMSVRAGIYHLAGHEVHHLNSMKEHYA